MAAGDIGSVVSPVSTVDLAQTVGSVTDLRQESTSRLTQIAIGQQLRGDVLSQFNDGTFLVRMADTAARMTLPANTRVGSSLLLTLTSQDPRPAFSVSEEPGEESSEVTLSTADAQTQKNQQLLRSVQQRVPNALNEDLAGLGDARTDADAEAAGDAARKNSTPTTLSAAGRLIDTLLQAGGQSTTPAAIQAKAPLMTGAPADVDTTKLAASLQENVNFSGVFYESHVAGWTEGKVPITDLQREPQAQLGPQAQSGGLLANADAANTQLGQLVNLQLNTLEQQRVVWNGEVWPGQQMEWEIDRHDPQDSRDQQSNGDSASDAAAWQTVVRFDFPNLGKVAAAIRVNGTQVQMQIRTQSDEAASTLRENGEALKNSLEAAGSSLDAFLVRRDG